MWTAHLDSYFSVLTLNCNGMRDSRKRGAIARLLYTKGVSVCVLTETHLRTQEVDRLEIPNYWIAASTSRDPEGRIRGGIIILVHHGMSAAPITAHHFVGDVIEYCSAVIYPTTCEDTGLIITGVYIPPDTGIPDRREAMKPLCYTKGTGNEQIMHSQIVMGDFNVTTWLETFEEWCATEGIWALNNPETPTHTRGFSIDKALFRPGHYIPSNLLAWYDGERAGEDCPEDSP